MNYPPTAPRKSNSRTRFDVAMKQRRATTRERAAALLGSRVRIAVAGLVVLVVLGWRRAELVLGAMPGACDARLRCATTPVCRPTAMMAASGIQGEHTQFVDLDAAAQRIDELAGCRGCAVTLCCSWDGACEIAIKETAARWRLAKRGGQVWVDDEGKVQRLRTKPCRRKMRLWCAWSRAASHSPKTDGSRQLRGLDRVDCACNPM